MSQDKLIRPAVALIIVAVVVYSITKGANDKPAEKPASAAKPVAATKTGKAVAAPPAADERSAVERALDKPIELKFKETPLKDVADAIGANAGINVLLDQKGLADAGIAPETPISFDAGPAISLRSALQLLLARYEMNFIVESDNILRITSEAKEKEHVTLRLYEVGDLATPQRTLSGTEPRLDGLVDIITSIINPTTWTAAGGTGSIVPLDTQLIVSQTAEIHEQIDDLLKSLRQVRDEPQKFGDGGQLEQPAGGPEAKILAGLRTPLDFDFHETTLRSLVEFLHQHGIPAELDTKALADAGMTPESPVNFKAKQVRLDVALRPMLLEHELNYVIDHEVLLITSDTKELEHVITKFYPVADFIGDTTGKSREEIDAAYQKLMDAITASIRPTTWDAAGGTGSLTPFFAGNALICNHTREAQEEVARLLAKLRVGRHAAKGAAITKPVDLSGPVTRFYRLSPDHADAAGDYAEVVRHLVEPKSWTGGEAYLGKVPGAVIAHCSPAAHEQIHALLNELEALPRPPIAPAKPATLGTGISSGFSGGSGPF